MVAAANRHMLSASMLDTASWVASLLDPMHAITVAVILIFFVMTIRIGTSMAIVMSNHSNLQS